MAASHQRHQPPPFRWYAVAQAAIAHHASPLASVVTAGRVWLAEACLALFALAVSSVFLESGVVRQVYHGAVRRVRKNTLAPSWARADV